VKKILLGIILSVTTLLSLPIANYQMDSCFWNGTSGEVKDNSDNHYDGTANGATTESNATAGGVLCHVGKFDGSSYVDMGDILSPNSDDWSIGVWVKWDGSSGEKIVYNKENLYEAKIQNGKFYYAWQPHWNWDGGVSLNANEWTYFVVTYDHNEQKIYKNGSLEYSRSQSGDMGSNTSKLLIAARGNTNPHNYFSGNIDELKIYKYALSNSAISDMYNNEKDGKNYDGSERVCKCIVPIADYRMDECGWNGTTGEVKDSSGYNYDGTAQNGASTERNVTAGGGLCHVGKFDSSSNKEYIKINNFKQISGNRTITTWIKINNLNSAGRIFADDKNNQNGDYALSYKDPGSGLLRFYIRGLSPISLDSTTVLQENQWYFIVAIFDADNMKKKLSIYDDGGSLIESVSQNVSGTLSQSEGDASIGGERDDGSEASMSTFDGDIDELKVFDKDLNTTQIQTIYNNERDEKNYNGANRTCPFCGPFIPVSNWQMDECFWDGTTDEVKDNSGNGYSGTAEGGATTESNATVGGVLCHVGKFDGSSYVDMGNILNPNSDDLSISVWVKWDGNSGERIIYNKENLYEAKINGGKFYYAWQPHWNWDGGVSLNANEWTHFVVTYDHNEQKIYKNGSLEYSRTQSGNIGSNSSKLLIAARGNTNPHNYFSGNIDELKIYNYALSNSAVSDMYNNEKDGKNYDGSERVCKSCNVIYYFDARDIFRDINDRNISTKIVNQDFNLTIASLDENGSDYQEFNGTVCSRIVIEGNISVTGWKKNFFNDINESNQTFHVSQAIKIAKVEIIWKENNDSNCSVIDDFEDNETNSTDNFALRPDRFAIENISSPIRAGGDFNITFSVVDESNASVKDYNESKGVSFEVNATEINSVCKTGDFNLNDFNFTDGNTSDINATYNEVGKIKIKIQEKNGSEFAYIDHNDTSDLQRLITAYEVNVTVLPHHFEVNATLKNRYSSFTYISQDLNMSAMLDLNITAQNEQNQTTENYNKSCYAKDTNYTISYGDIDNSLTKILYQDTNTSDINKTDLNNSIIFDRNASIFITGENNGSANIQLLINFDRNRSVGVSPFDLNITDINVTDSNNTFGKTAPNNSATFYYGRVKTKDISTNKQEVNHSVHVEVYKLGKYHQDSLNWYINGDDNDTNITTLIPQESFTYKADTNKTGIALDKNSSLSISDGIANFTIKNSWASSDSSYIHVKIPSYLWYNSYEDYNFSDGSDCSTHPCFQYIYNKDGAQKGIQSGDFNGSNIGYDYNATKTKKGIKVFR